MVLLNTQSVHSEDDFANRNDRPVASRYHMVIQNAEEKAAKSSGAPGLSVEFQVIADGLMPDGKTKTTGQTSKTIPKFFAFCGADDEKTKSCMDSLTRFAMAAGIIQPGEEKEPDWLDAIGRELIVEVEHEYDKATRKATDKVQVAWLGFWRLLNPAVANVPKDAMSPGMKAAIQAGGGNGNGSGNGNQMQAQQPQGNGNQPQPAATAQAPAQTTAKKRDYSSL
jgi:hypothetical protein